MATATILKNTASYLRRAIDEIDLADAMGIDISTTLSPEQKKLHRQRLRHAKRELSRVIKDLDP